MIYGDYHHTLISLNVIVSFPHAIRAEKEIVSKTWFIGTQISGNCQDYKI